MRVVVIGGTGHIGTYLAPSLVEAGHETVVISRGTQKAYRDDDRWQDVEMVVCDREAAERDGTFGTTVAELEPDAVIDLTCFTPTGRATSSRHWTASTSSTPAPSGRTAPAPWC